jgi:hypothetical protein
MKPKLHTAIIKQHDRVSFWVLLYSILWDLLTMYKEKRNINWNSDKFYDLIVIYINEDC